MAAVILLSYSSSAKSAHELWKTQFTGEGGIQSFDRSGMGLWLFQQGVFFISPDRLVVYQVNRSREPAPLAKRTASGGSGNYHLLARIFAAHTGKEIKRMEFITSSGYSAILPTHDGKFLVRAGDILGLYSADFELLAAKNLPMGTAASLDYWQVSVTPSGQQIALVHQQRYVDEESLRLHMQPKVDKSESDVEILNADTLATVKRFHLPSYLPAWSADEQFLLSTPPGKVMTDSHFGTLDFDGHWTALPLPENADKRCVFNYQPLAHDLLLANGCGSLTVFPESGETVLTVPHVSREKYASTVGSGDFLAVESEEYVMHPLKPQGFEPAHVRVYDLKSQEQIISAKLETLRTFFAVSPEGLLAVVDSDVLKVYEAKE